MAASPLDSETTESRPDWSRDSNQSEGPDAERVSLNSGRGVIAVLCIALGAISAFFGFKQYLIQKYQVHHEETSQSSNV
jgi:hypothetical protein